DELLAWLQQSTGDETFGPCAIGVRAALAAAARTTDSSARKGWEDAAHQFFAAGIASCEAMSARGAARRLVLTRLRWLQGQPERKAAAWSEVTRSDVRRMEEKLEQLLAEQLQH